MTGRPKTSARQSSIDAFYRANGPCCAGCDWWQHFNSFVGECTASPPVSGTERVAMLGIESSSISPGAGHIMTLRDHKCGQFVDTFDWTKPL